MNLDALATNGVFNATDAARVGITSGELRRLDRDGMCHRLVRGWYAVGPLGDPRSEHRLRTTALVRHLPGVCASHHSRLILDDLPTIRAALDVVHVTRLADKHSRHRRGAVIHPCLDGMVSLAHAVVQTGVVNGADDALVGADAALHRRLMTPDDLAEALERFHGHPNTVEVRRVLGMADGRAESPGETLVRRILVEGGIPVTPQLTIHDGPVSWRADLVVDGTRVLVEFDGLVKYGSSDDLIAEKRREDRLRALGFIVVRVTWADLRRPDHIVAEVRRAVARSRPAA
jgi:very-short-patch-repair endonuclease